MASDSGPAPQKRNRWKIPRKQQITGHADYIQEDIREIGEAGDEVTLVRVRGLTAKPNAVRVVIEKGVIGLMPDHIAEGIAPKLEAGHKYTARIGSKVRPDPDYPPGVNVGIYLFMPDTDITYTRTAQIVDESIKKGGCLTSIALASVVLALVVAHMSFIFS